MALTSIITASGIMKCETIECKSLELVGRLEKDTEYTQNSIYIRGPLIHDPGVPPVASQYNFIVQPLVTKEWNTRAF